MENQNNQEALSSNTAPTYESENFGLGLITALIGAGIATIPWIIIGYFGFTASYAGYLIGLGAFKGYIFGEKKASKKAFYLIIAFILVYIPLAQITTIGLMFVKEGFAPIPSNFALLFETEGIMGEIGINLAIGYLFAFLGTKNLLGNLKALKS